MVILNAIENGYLILAIIMILMSVISAGYYLRLMKIMYFDSHNFEITNNNNIISNNSNSLNSFNSSSNDNPLTISFTNNNLFKNNNLTTNYKEYFSNAISL